VDIKAHLVQARRNLRKAEERGDHADIARYQHEIRNLRRDLNSGEVLGYLSLPDPIGTTRIDMIRTNLADR
jgi:hypothetical protein